MIVYLLFELSKARQAKTEHMKWKSRTYFCVLVVLTKNELTKICNEPGNNVLWAIMYYVFRKLKISNGRKNFRNIFTGPIVSAVGCNFGDQPGNDVKNLAAAFHSGSKWLKTRQKLDYKTREIVWLYLYKHHFDELCV